MGEPIEPNLLRLQAFRVELLQRNTRILVSSANLARELFWLYIIFSGETNKIHLYICLIKKCS